MSVRTDATSTSTLSESNLPDPSTIDVLVVDDDRDINMLLQARMRTRGFRIRAAFDGVEALRAIEESQPDLMLLDVSMPEMGGLDVLKHIRSNNLDICVIMTTAFGTEQVAVEALRLGADDYLRKPFEPVELRATVDRTIGRQYLQRQNAALRVRLQEQHRQLEAELMRAAQVQASLLPAASPGLDGFELVAHCLPAREVSGDFYDWHALTDDRCVFSLGDVMGKGMPAALLMATVRSALRAVAPDHGPQEALDLVERALEPDLDRSGSFVTLFHADLDTRSRTCTYVDAGHGHGFVRRANGNLEPFEQRRPPVGLAFGTQSAASKITMDQGDALILYSDGLIDARPDLNLTPDLVAAELAGTRSAQDMLARLLALATPGADLLDDLTLLVLYCGAESP